MNQIYELFVMSLSNKQHEILLKDYSNTLLKALTFYYSNRL